MRFRSWVACVVAGSVLLFATGAIAEDLSIDKLALRVRTSTRVAHTKMTLVIKNGGNHQWEEAFVELNLPIGTAVTGLSMDVGLQKDRPRMQGRLLDAEKAADVYQDIVDSLVDPAILEDMGEGRFELRVFPVPAHDKKTVIIEYEHLLPQNGDKASYVLDPPRLKSGPNSIASVSLVMDGKRTKLGPWPSDQVIHVPLKRAALDPIRVQYTQHGGHTYFRAEFVPQVEVQAIELGAVVLAIDSSRTSPEQWTHVLAQTRKLHAALVPGTEIRVVRGDHRATVCNSLDCTSNLRPAGAANLGALLRVASKEADELPGRVAIVLVSDGHDTALDEDDLIAQAESLPHALHVLGVGFAQERFLRQLAHAGGGHLALDADELLRRIDQPLVDEIRAEVTAGEVEGLGPMLLAPTPQHQASAIFGRLKSASASLVVTARVGLTRYEQTIELSAPSHARNRSVMLGWMRVAPWSMASKISELNVLRSERAFLVLETDKDYLRLEEDSGDMAGRRATRPPPVLMISAVMASGSLSRNPLRRRIRLAAPKIRHCYNRLLRREPGMEGTMNVAWNIDHKGQPHDVAVHGDIDEDEFRTCIIDVHKGIQFPSVPGNENGIVRVHNYPYHFVAPYKRKCSVECQQLDELIAYGFDPKASHLYRLAGIEKLNRGASETKLWLRLVESFRRDVPEELITNFGKRKPDTSTSVAVLHRLIDAGASDLASKLAQSWQRGPMGARALYAVFTRSAFLQEKLRERWLSVLLSVTVAHHAEVRAMDTLIELVIPLGRNKLAADRVLLRCRRASPECERWLASDLRDARLRPRLHALLQPRMLELERSRSTEAEVREFARLLDLVGDSKDAIRVRSEKPGAWKPWLPNRPGRFRFPKHQKPL